MQAPLAPEPTAVLALAGHAVRITGLLPPAYDAPLRFWAEPTLRSGGRVEVTLVYPVATARLKDERGAPTGNANPLPADDDFVSAYPYAPSDPVEGAGWGGFPSLEYDLERRLAFPGPITAENGTCRLLRGPASHGSARMQGEHVVETAHLMGLGTAGFTRPIGGPEQVAVFTTRSTEAFPRFVCAHDSARPLGDDHCDALPETGANPLRPADLGEIACPAGFTPLSVGDAGGRLCTDGQKAWGPFTQALTSLGTRGGRRPELHAGPVVAGAGKERARAGRVSPGRDARRPRMGDCSGGDEASGPFPGDYVATCEAAWGGRAFRSARRRGDFLRRTVARLGSRTAGAAQ